MYRIPCPLQVVVFFVFEFKDLKYSKKPSEAQFITLNYINTIALFTSVVKWEWINKLKTNLLLKIVEL
jgi:hypothetical protein